MQLQKLSTATIPNVARGSRSVTELAKSLIDPTLTLCTLAGSTWLHGQTVGGPEILLGLIVFSLTYPGTIPFRHRKLGLVREILGSWGLVVGLLLALGYSTGYLSVFSQDVLVGWVLATPVATWLVHFVSPRLVPHVVALSSRQSAVVVGTNEIGQKLAAAINGDPLGTQRVIAYFDDRSPERVGAISGPPLAGTLEALAAFVKANHVNTIYIALPMASQPRILRLLDTLRDTTASIYFVPDIFLYDLIQARVDAVGGMPVVAVCESPFHGITGVIKRLSDLAIASAAIIALAPVMLTVAAAVALTSPGPIIFRQRRYGLDGEEIIVWKFRTMRVMEDGTYVRQASRADSRITPLGRFLRRTSLDELPQFFNVLQGRMSVVGPRPHAVAHNETYRKLIKGYMVRHKVKPGITGLAQVSGARGETETVEDMERRIRYDLEYLRRWSLQLDLRILVRTALLAVKGDPQAY